MILPQVVASKTQGKYNCVSGVLIRETSYFNSLEFCQICKTNYHYAKPGGSGLITLLINKIGFVF